MTNKKKKINKKEKHYGPERSKLKLINRKKGVM